MDNNYTNNLVKRLTDTTQWAQPRPSEEFLNLAKSVKDDVKSNTVSSKIAVILVHHQIMHELTKNLIHMSTLYIQGEIWPTKLDPSYDNNNEKMTGWYLNYLQDHCIDFKHKDEYLELALRLNKLRNKVAHELTGKNDTIINQSYNEFTSAFSELHTHYEQCEKWLFYLLDDLTKRVDFEEFMHE